MNYKNLYVGIFIILLTFILSCESDTDVAATDTSATIATLNCTSVTFSATATANTVYVGTASVPYTGGSVTTYAEGGAIASTGVTGLTAKLSAGTLATSGNLTYVISGIPSGAGTATFPISFGGQSCSLVLTVGSSTTPVTPTTPITPLTGYSFPAFSNGNGNVAQIVAAANTFLGTLDASQKATVLLDFNSTKKSVWSNYPISDVARNGLLTGKLTGTQRAAAYAIIEMLCSQYGYEELAKTMEADQYLVNTTNPNWTGGTANYAIAIFGTPSTSTPWMIQYGGHHMALNATIVGQNVALTPTLNGAQPTKFSVNGVSYTVWQNQTDKGFTLINALTTAQRSKAILSYTVSNLVLGPGNDGKTISPEGIKGADLTTDQQTLLLDLVSQWTNIANTTSATTKLNEIKANINDTYFAWSGSTTSGSGNVYFRIQGPTVLIEYATQFSAATHIHNMYRDPTNDYGKKWL